jgi:hypothetical protein
MTSLGKSTVQNYSFQFVQSVHLILLITVLIHVKLHWKLHQTIYFCQTHRVIEIVRKTLKLNQKIIWQVLERLTFL